MTKATASPYWNAGTDAIMRTLGAAVKAMFLAAGLTQTADTGQIDWTTYTRPALNTPGGYEVYRMNDANQATAPVFLRLEWAIGNAADRPSLRMDLGSATNGAGTLVGSTQYVAGLASSLSNAGNWEMRVCYNPTLGVLNFSTGNVQVPLNPAFADICWSLERLKNADGTPSARGCTVVCQYAQGPNYPNYMVCRTWQPLGAFSGETEFNIPAFWPVPARGAASAGGTFVAGLTPLTGNGTHGPLEKTLGFLVCGYGDFADGAVFPITRWDGQVHTYLATRGYGAGALQSSTTINTFARWAVLWE